METMLCAPPGMSQFVNSRILLQRTNAHSGMSVRLSYTIRSSDVEAAVTEAVFVRYDCHLSLVLTRLWHVYCTKNKFTEYR